MKVTIITPVLNCFEYISDCIASVISQDYQDIEYIVIDGGSTDGTVSVIQRYVDHITYFLSEEDCGMYDALNKGISLASGDLIGTLNADDWLAGGDIISSVVKCFKQNDCDAVYGNLDFIRRSDIKRVSRKWRSGPYCLKKIEYGWMPAHPTLYIKSDLFKTLNVYSPAFGPCADYEFIIRLLYKNKAKAMFIDKLFVLMRNGGISNGSARKIWTALTYDYKALVDNEMPMPILILILKRIRKLKQFFH